MVKVSKVVKLADKITDDQLNTFIDNNGLNIQGNVEINNVRTKKFKIPGNIRSSAFRTNVSQAYLLRLYQRSGNQSLRTILADRTFTSNESEERTLYVGILGPATSLPQQRGSGQSEVVTEAPVPAPLPLSSFDRTSSVEVSTNTEPTTIEPRDGPSRLARATLREAPILPPQETTLLDIIENTERDTMIVDQILDSITRSLDDIRKPSPLRGSAKTARNERKGADLKLLRNEIRELKETVLLIGDEDLLEKINKVQSLSDVIRNELTGGTKASRVLSELDTPSDEGEEMPDFIQEFLTSTAPPQTMLTSTGTQARPTSASMGTQTPVRTGAPPPYTPPITTPGVVVPPTQTQAIEVSQPPVPVPPTISEPVPRPDIDIFQTVDGRTIDFTSEDPVDRLDQIEFLFNTVTAIAPDRISQDIHSSAVNGLQIIREARTVNETPQSIFSKILGVSKVVLTGIASIPIIPPTIRAVAAGTLTGILAVEGVAKLVQGDNVGTTAIQAGLELAGAIVPQLSEATETISAGVDLVSNVIDFKNDLFIHDDQAIEGEDIVLLEGGLEDKVAVKLGEEGNSRSQSSSDTLFIDKENGQEEIVISGTVGSEEFYKNPVHPDALGIYFQSSEFPKWDTTLLSNRVQIWKNLDKQEYVPYLLQQSLKIVNKYSIDIFVDKVKYTNLTPEFYDLIIKENSEIVQLFSALKQIRSVTVLTQKLDSLISKTSELIGTSSELNESNQMKNGNTLSDDIVEDSGTSKKGFVSFKNNFQVRIGDLASEDHVQHAMEEQSLAEVVTREGAKPIIDRKNFQGGWGSAGYRANNYQIRNMKMSFVDNINIQPPTAIEDTEADSFRNFKLPNVKIPIC